MPRIHQEQQDHARSRHPRRHVVDGTGAAQRVADVAVDGATITAVGGGLGPRPPEIDAHGLLVTPGFVDVHTHYDGQATWDP